MSTDRKVEQLAAMKLRELHAIAEQLKLRGFSRLSKDDLVSRLADTNGLERVLNPSWWSKYHNHVYGVATLVGLVPAIIVFFPFTDSAQQLVEKRNEFDQLLVRAEQLYPDFDSTLFLEVTKADDVAIRDYDEAIEEFKDFLQIRQDEIDSEFSARANEIWRQFDDARASHVDLQTFLSKVEELLATPLVSAAAIEESRLRALVDILENRRSQIAQTDVSNLSDNKAVNRSTHSRGN